MVQAVCNISDGTVAPHAAIEALNDWGAWVHTRSMHSRVYTKRVRERVRPGVLFQAIPE